MQTCRKFGNKNKTNLHMQIVLTWRSSAELIPAESMETPSNSITKALKSQSGTTWNNRDEYNWDKMHSTCRCFATMHLRACRINVVMIGIKKRDTETGCFLSFYVTVHTQICMNFNDKINSKLERCIIKYYNSFYHN